MQILSNIYFQDYLPIKELAMKIFAIPLTSAPIERVFSHVGFATRLHRSNTELELLESQLMAYINGYLKKDVIP